MNRKLFFLVIILLVLLFAGIGFGLFRSKNIQNIVGETSPHFALITFDGKEIQSEKYLGKIIVVKFWASWCDTCAEEASLLEEVWKEYEPSNEVFFVGVNYVDTEKDALAYLEKYAITYPNGPDKGLQVSRLFVVKGVPETVFIDRQGKVAYKKIGPFSTKEEFISIIEKIKK